MLSTENAIFRLRRDLALCTLLKALLLVASVGALVLPPIVAPQLPGGVALLAIAVFWVVLSYNSAKGARLSADAPALIAAGQYEQAEEQIDESLKRFSVIRAVKFQTLHHLALLRHAQKRYRESAMLCRTLLRQRLGPAASLARPVRLLLADAMLELDDVQGTYDALSGLYRDRLSLGEALNLLSAQLDYESRVGAWERMFHEVMSKVQLAELMPASSAAKAQAMLALAARRVGREDFCGWLRQRTELLADPSSLIAQRAMLAELWPPSKRIDELV